MASARYRLVAAALLASAPLFTCLGTRVFAQAAAPADNQPAEDSGPMSTPLTVGALQIGSDAALVVETASVTVTTDQVAYEYRLKNKGATTLVLSASVTMPDLEVSSDGKAAYELPAPDNPVALVVTANQKPIATTPYVQAIALGIDRIADLKAEHIPLVPFSADADKALAAAKPETVAKLASLGLVTPNDPTQPTNTPVADWSLHVTQGWMQRLEPNAATVMAISFAPIKATYVVDKDALAAFEDLKDQICLTPKISTALKALLKTKTATLDVADITLSTDRPARWIDSPGLMVQVKKPKPTSIAVFCGQDAASVGQSVVKGTIGDDGSSDGLRVMIFTPSAP